MRRSVVALAATVLLLGDASAASGAGSVPSQASYELPQPYLEWERAYLAEFPDVQKVMDAMIATSARQLKDPAQDILHNRVCAALAYHMARSDGAPRAARRLGVVADLLHNIAKEEKGAVLSNASWYEPLAPMAARLRAAGYLQGADRFLSDVAVLRTPKVADNMALVHHLTGAVMAGRMLREMGGYSAAELDPIEDAILTHSTGYWYFRASVDEAAGRQGAWEAVYPEPRTAIAKYAHDADLVSQFVPETVIPEGSKWRGLAQKRWGAKTPRDEARVVHYVFARMLAEARTPAGRALAMEKWQIIEPPLLAAMDLKPGQDPVQVYGVPAAFQEKGASVTTTETLTYDGATTIGNGIIKPAAALFEQRTGVKFTKIGTSGAGKGLKAALAGEVSIGGVSRKLTPEESAGAYVETIGYDAVGIFVNEKNPVASLSSAQLKAIFTGKVRSWKEVGGPDLPITACSEALKGGRATVETFKQMILEGQEFGPVTERDDAVDCLQIVARDPSAISYASMGYVVGGTRSVPLDGVSPKPADIRTGGYKLSRPLNLVARNPTPAGKQFVQLVLSPEGQRIVAKSYVPVKE